jgi:hypothetical protein
MILGAAISAMTFRAQAADSVESLCTSSCLERARL